MSDFLEADYTRWGERLVAWTDIEDFTAAADLSDGVHVIGSAPGPPLEILIRRTGSALNTEVLPVFFTGAIDKRSEKTGPFFSGEGLSQDGGFGFVAVSDPSLNVDPSVGLAWYAGNKHQDIQGLMVQALSKIGSYFGRELLLVGGSGGGFAALYCGLKLGGKCSVFVWNPQTDILKYNPTAVKNYFLHAFGPGIVDSLNAPTWEKASRSYLEKEPVTTDLMGLLDSGEFPRRMLIFQNASDWHVTHHLAPLLRQGDFKHRGRGIYERRPEQLAVIADFGLDHAPLPAPAILAGILSGLDVEMDAGAILQQVKSAIPASTQPLSSLPRDLRGIARIIENELVLKSSRTDEGRQLAVDLGAMPSGYGGIRYSFFHRAPEGNLVFEQPQVDPVFAFTQIDLAEVGVMVRDGFLNEILVLRERVS